MDFESFINEMRSAPGYAGQVVYVHEVPAREAQFADAAQPLPEPVARALAARGIQRLYSHQAEAINRVRAGEDVVVVTGPASGKTLCYVVPILESLLADGRSRALLVFPTKALTQDQFKGFGETLKAAGMDEVLAGVYDGDTPGPTRRKLRDKAAVIFTNPDMLHAAVMPQHGRWAQFLANLRFLVVDELHTYSGIFGSNMANLLLRLRRVCRHYGSDPRVIACSATIGNPRQLAERLIGRAVSVVDDDGSPRGRRTYVFWNPPRVRGTDWHSRRSANVEAHELMAMLVQRGVPTITFSKAKMTAEMIYRYVCDKLREEAPQLAQKVSPYRGGYLPQERREIERRLFSGELLGVSTTRALELGIDVGGLDASIVVGYPGTLASFFQQSGRAGREDRDALVVLVGLDTTVNQYVMSHPDYVFGRPVEEAVIEPENPFVVTGHLRCATHELPLPEAEAGAFGPHAPLALRVLEGNGKVRRIEGSWYHAARETPQHEVSLRNWSDRTVLIQDAETGAVLGQLDEFDAPPIVHPGAIYMHQGDTYQVLELDLGAKAVARVKKVEVDYYTQPIGGADVHHIDHRLREKPFGAGAACWGEVTVYDHTAMYEKVHFYSLDAISQHGVDLPPLVLETMALWIVPPEELMRKVLSAGLDAHSGLRGIGYATRMMLPLFITCETLDFSHTIGGVNAPWNAIFIYERFPHGLGFTEKAYERLHEVMPAVLENIRGCPCADGCPCCVGKPLRQYATWNVERGEGSVPSKKSAVMILESLLADGAKLNLPDAESLTDSADDAELRLERALKRRLERGREPKLFHPIEPQPKTRYPEPEKPEVLSKADVARRAEKRREIHQELRRRVAKKIPDARLSPYAAKPAPPSGMKLRGSAKPPTHFPGRPPARKEAPAGPAPGPSQAKPEGPQKTSPPIYLGDSLAAKARKLRKERGGPSQDRPGP